MIKHHIVFTDFCDWTFELAKAKDSYIWDENGNKYIDFTSGWNVTNLGWNNDEVKRAMKQQIDKNLYAPMWMNDEIQRKYAQELLSSLPKELDIVVRTTGGTEANEKALLLARFITGRKKIIGFTDTYHGHSYGTISIGYRPEYVTGEAPLVPEFIHMNFPVSEDDENIDQRILNQFLIDLEKILINKDVAALVTEAGIITGWGSTFVAPKGYLSAVRKLTQKYGTFLILDEVGTGFSRCGKLFGMEFEGVVPDMVTFAKGMTNGAGAMSAVVTKSSFNEDKLSKAKTHSTFGWNSVATAACMAVLKIHKRDKVWEKAEKDGKYLIKSLRDNFKNHPKIGSIHGLGMEVGLTFVTDKKSNTPDDNYAIKIINQSKQKGLHLIFGGDGNIQIMPPLVIERGVLDRGIDILIDVIKKNTVS